MANKITYAGLFNHVTSKGKVISENDWWNSESNKRLFSLGDNINFRLADARNDYIGGAGIANVGDWEADSFKEHQHISGILDNAFLGAYEFGKSVNGHQTNIVSGARSTSSLLTSKSVALGSDTYIGGSKTQPQTLRLLHCIKY